MLAYQPSSGTDGKAIVGSVINFTATAGTTTYFAPWYKSVSTTEVHQRAVLPRGGTLGNNYAYVKTASSGGNTTTLTIEKNGSDSSAVVSITNGSSGTITESGTASVSRGDGVDMKIASVGGTGPIIGSWSSDLH